MKLTAYLVLTNPDTIWLGMTYRGPQPTQQGLMPALVPIFDYMLWDFSYAPPGTVVSLPIGESGDAVAILIDHGPNQYPYSITFADQQNSRSLTVDIPVATEQQEAIVVDISESAAWQVTSPAANMISQLTPIFGSIMMIGMMVPMVKGITRKK